MFKRSTQNASFRRARHRLERLGLLAALLPLASFGQEATREPSQRIHADAFILWIYRKPERDPTPLGYLRAGQSVPLRQDDPVSRRGCSGGWFAVQPAGFVCLDRHASLTETRYGRAMRDLEPSDGPFPFDFALSMGTPSYRRIPTPAEVARRERKFGRAKPTPLPPHWRGHEELVGAAPDPPGRPGWFLEGGGSVAREGERRLERRVVPFGSMLALRGTFEAEGRTYLQSADGTLVPLERMRLFRRSEFSGVALGSNLTLPLAWTRKEAELLSFDSSCAHERPSEEHRKGASAGCLRENGSRTQVRQLVRLTGRRTSREEGAFVELREGHWLRESDLFLAEESVPPPDRERWIHFSLSQGTLVAYEQGRPVFATLASPGIGGLPKNGGSPLEDRTTPVGTYRIHFKHRSDDMSPEVGEHRSFWIADVPFTMYFKQPFAIHVAYWHESFGEPMSGGCINVSPKDGKWLFDWTTPTLPEGWYGVSASEEFGWGTTLTVER